MAKSGFRFEVDTRIMDDIIRATPDEIDRLGRMAATEMVNDVVMSFNSGPSGRSYPRGKNRVHIASQPGHPPNVDTGTLRASMRWSEGRHFEWFVHDGVEYGIDLEYGTEVIAPRPFIGPVFWEWKQRKLKTLAERILDLD